MNMLALPRSILRRCSGGPAWLVLASHKWATLAWPVNLHANGDAGMMFLDPLGECQWIFVHDPLGWVVYPAASMWSQAGGVSQDCDLSNDTWHLHHYAISRAPEQFTFLQLSYIVESMGLHNSPSKCTRSELLELILAGTDLLDETLQRDKKQKSCHVTKEEEFLEELLESMDRDEAAEFADVGKALKAKRAAEKKTDGKRCWTRGLQRRRSLDLNRKCFIINQ